MSRYFSFDWHLPLLSLLMAFAVAVTPARAQPSVTVGSKAFTESHVLAEIVAQHLEANGVIVQRRLGLGGTLITYEALRQGELDIYPEYTGTLTRAVLNSPALTPAEIDVALGAQGLEFFVRLGFNNTYAIAVSADLATSRAISQISDLAAYPALNFGFSHEFLNREDGWPALRERYKLPQTPTGIEHALAYRALDSGQLDVTDAYSTDGELDVYGLLLLDDDRGLFPVYDAGYLVRQDLPQAVGGLLEQLSGLIDAPLMRRLNRQVSVDGQTPAAVAAAFLREQGFSVSSPRPLSRQSRILHNTLVHLKLTAIALGLGCLVAIPLALLVARLPRIAAALQYTASLVQTIPALALLALFIPLLGLGQLTAITALFLYSLLPIVRNTLAGLAGVDPLLKEVARSLGLTATQQVLKIELPLAAPMIIAGIKTAAIISIGTATLAAFVGAGGLGEPIITGLSLNNNSLILEGALPAAALAISVELLFELVERQFVPAHLRVRAG